MKNILKPKVFLYTISVVLLTSCVAKIDIPRQNGIKGYLGTNSDSISIIAKDNETRLNEYKKMNPESLNKKDLKWGLAMSGGGIRSASVNIGVLKALYDMNILDSIDVVSSVSGGSYAAGWFFTNEILNTSDRKGQPLFDNKHILLNINYIKNRANMFRTPTMLGTLFASKKNAFNLYKSKINRTFMSMSTADRSLSSYQNAIANNKIPLFIINTSVSRKDDNDWLSSVYEYTAFYRGNPEIDFEKIDSTNDINIDEAVTISGAALKFKLLRKTKNYSNKIQSKYIPLCDGGKSENLGAISLIRRGVKNIIIIDAEYDKDYEFGSYDILKRYLNKELHLEISVPTVDSLLRKKNKESNLLTSVHKGTIKSIYIEPNNILKPININVYYIKMAIPNSLQTVLNNDTIFLKGSCLDKEIQQIEKKIQNKECALDKLIFSTVIKNENDFYALSTYWVKSYSDWLNNSKWKYVGYKFPQTNTADQSFYSDQFCAFIGLGYMQAFELRSVLKK